MNRLKALSEYFGYNTLVMRDGSIHRLDIADLFHAEDLWWDVKLVLYPLSDPTLCPGTLEEVIGFIEGLKISHVDFLGLIKDGKAISVESLEKDPYKD